MGDNRLTPRAWSVLGVAGAVGVALVVAGVTGPDGERAAANRTGPASSRTTAAPDDPAGSDRMSAPPTSAPYATATFKPGRHRLTATGGRPFADASAWNTPIPDDPRQASGSRAVVRHLSKEVVANLYAYGTPVYTVTGPASRQDVRCRENWGPCLLRSVPIPDHARPASGSDGSMIVIDQPRRTVYDFWRADRTDGGWQASWGTANPLYGMSNENGGAVGAGHSLLAGLVRRFEIRRGRIDHALHFSSDNSCAGRYAYPATKTDGTSHAADCVPEGARVQLDPSIDVDEIPGITRAEKAVARALQKYGAYDQDNGGAAMALAFEDPAGRLDPYPAAGLTHDYARFPHIPWHRMRVLASWNGR